MAKIRFTDLGIRSLREGLYFCERTPSFGLRVGKNRKTWLVNKGGTKIRLGHYPAMSLQLARSKALVVIGSPLEVPQCPIFPEAREQYLAQGEWRPRTRFESTRILNKYFHWTKPIDKITHRDVAEALDEIRAKSEIIHAFRNVSALFRWCVPRYLQNSPCTGLRAPPRNAPRSRVLSDDEL